MEELIKAWKDSGINPSYHMKVKSRLMAEWPVLAKAITELIDSYDRGTLLQSIGDCNHKWTVIKWTKIPAKYKEEYEAQEVMCTKCLTLSNVSRIVI